MNEINWNQFMLKNPNVNGKIKYTNSGHEKYTTLRQ